MYGPLNQYHVVMGVDPRFAQDIESLKQVEVITATGVRVPMSAFARFEDANAPLSVQHQGLFVADTVSFSRRRACLWARPRRPSTRRWRASGCRRIRSGGLPGYRRRPAADAGAAALADPGRPGHHVYRAGHPVRELRAPLTILSTLPSAGLGALLALLMLRQDFTLIALIGVFLLIGIVKKNAIMMVDFALEAERTQAGAARRDLPGLPDALPSHHDDDHGRHLRRAAADAGHRRRRRDAPAAGHHHRGRPVLSQILTLYTTPVVYLYLDRFRLWAARRRSGARRPFLQNIHDPQRQAVVFPPAVARRRRSRCAPCWAPAPSGRLSAPGAGHRRILQGRAGRGAGLETRRTA